MKNNPMRCLNCGNIMVNDGDTLWHCPVCFEGLKSPPPHERATPTEGWEEEFDKISAESKTFNENYDKTKAFIRTTIASAVKKERKRIEKTLYTESGFLREDENVASDVLHSLKEQS